jgi:NTP pyrophosphatase (non-canonical NTP hydrolase)
MPIAADPKLWHIAMKVSDVQDWVLSLASTNSQLQLAILNADSCQTEKMKSCLRCVCGFASACGFDLVTVLRRKIAINREKYDPKLCVGRTAIHKYTEDALITGHTKDENRHRAVVKNGDQHSVVANELGMDVFDDLIVQLERFSVERGWNHMYTTRSLLSSVLCELGELAEVFQWTDGSLDLDSVPMDQLNHLASEMADVTIYLLHICRVNRWCGSTFFSE